MRTLDVKTYAEIRGVSEQTIYNLINSNKLEIIIKNGKKYIVIGDEPEQNIEQEHPERIKDKSPKDTDKNFKHYKKSIEKLTEAFRSQQEQNDKIMAILMEQNGITVNTIKEQNADTVATLKEHGNVNTEVLREQNNNSMKMFKELSDAYSVMLREQLESKDEIIKSLMEQNKELQNKLDIASEKTNNAYAEAMHQMFNKVKSISG